MSAVQSALSNIQAVKLVFAQGNLGADNVIGGTGADADQITHEGVLDISGGNTVITPLTTGGNTGGHGGGSKQRQSQRLL